MRTATIYLKIIDGSEAYMPVEASDLGNNTFLILPNENYDKNDHTVLWSFRPGDKIKAKAKIFEFSEGEGLVAERFLDYTFFIKDYNWFLYNFLTNQIYITRENKKEFGEHLSRLSEDLNNKIMYYPDIVRKFQELKND
jgi:hypothetical protein